MRNWTENREDIFFLNFAIQGKSFAKRIEKIFLEIEKFCEHFDVSWMIEIMFKTKISHQSSNDLEAKFYFAVFLVLSLSFLLSIWSGNIVIFIISILEFF